MRTVIAPASILLAFSSAAGVGIFFGFYPADQSRPIRPYRSLEARVIRTRQNYQENTMKTNYLDYHSIHTGCCIDRPVTVQRAPTFPQTR